ncbi:hypothetical protein APA_943 [Pseudanabaena sp. lw0831]|nr:PIG-L family deacetylase [Pseudanabaena sp. lw0831]GBO51702.1 hypothetical protein APA_943 [Pseudanabaena sp. lw0831]
MAEGATSREIERNREKFQDELSALTIAANQASKMLGVSSLLLHDFPDNRMDSCDLLDIVKVIEQHQPQIVYTHHSGDVNIDHRRIHEAVITACRPLPNHSVHTLFFFEVPSSTEWQTSGSDSPFIPNWFYRYFRGPKFKTQSFRSLSIRDASLPSSAITEAIEYLARWRGATIGVKAAESFMLGRNIVK